MTAPPPWERKRKLAIVGGLPFLALVAIGVVVVVGSGAPEPSGVGDAELPEAEPPIDPVDLAVEEATTAPDQAQAAISDEDYQEVRDAGAEAGASLVVPEQDASPGDVLVHEGRVGKGFTVHRRLVGHGLPAREAHALLAALDGRYDFRKSRPSHTYRLEVDRTSGEVVRFRYQAGLTELYEVRPTDDGYSGRKVKVPTQLERVRTGFVVRGTLSESIATAGLQRGILGAFLRAFEGDINFQNEQREGDTFRVIADAEQLRGRFIRYKTVWALEYAGERVGERRAIYFRPGGEDGGYYDQRGRSMDRSFLRSPLSYSRITSPFNPRRFHPILRRRVAHNGVDFAAARGTPVWATAAGVVRFVGRKGAAGNLVILDHEGGLESIYAHLQRFASGLRRGDEVRQRQVIGFVGSTGRSTGPHLHFGLRKGGRFVDPMKMKSRPGPPVEARYRADFRRHAKRLIDELKTIPAR